MKLCKDCKHATKEWVHWWCVRVANRETSLVTGEQCLVGRLLCTTERVVTKEAYCGPEGRFFEPKEASRE